MRTSTRLQLVTAILLLVSCAAVAVIGNPFAATVSSTDHLAEQGSTHDVASAVAVAIDTGSMDKLPGALNAILKRDAEVLAVEVVPEDGQPAIRVGSADILNADGASRPSTVHRVTLVRGGKAWGVVNVHFKPTALAMTLGGGLPWFVVMLVVLVLPITLVVIEGVRRRLDRTPEGPMAVAAGRAQHTLDTLAEGVLLLDGAGRVVFANHALCEAVESTPAALAGTPVDELPWAAVVEGSGQAERPWGSVMKSGTPLRGERIGLRRADSTVVFMVNCTPLFRKPGQLHGVLVTLDDVTELEHNRIQLQDARDAAQHANEAKSRFLAMMSHEIRTPLNGVCGTLQLLRKTPLQKGQSQYIEAAAFSASTLLHLINDVLDLSKIEAGQLELSPIEFEVEECIDRTMLMMVPAARAKGLVLAYDIEAGVWPRFMADPDRIRQIIINLTNNAIKFTERGSVSLRIAVAHDHPDKQVLSCSVADTGIGIPADKMHRLFKAFSQVDSSTSRQYGGTGLGLVISKQLCEAMGGRIDVASTAGAGTTFTFTIELQKVGAATPASELPAPVDISTAVLIGLHELEASRTRVALGLSEDRVIVAATVDALGPLNLTDRVNAEGGHAALIIAASSGEDLAQSLDAVLRLLPREKTRVVVAVDGHDTVLPKGIGPHGTILRPIGAGRLLRALRPGASGNVDGPGDDDGAQGQPRDLAGLRILLAEDNPVGQMVVSDMLRGFGAHCDVAGDGNEVLAAVQRQTYDAVLMDCFMPNLDGFGATRKIRELQQQGKLSEALPVIALTAKAMRGDREACMEAGMDGYITKPVDQDELLRIVTQHTAHAERQAPQQTSSPAPPGLDAASLRERYRGKAQLLRKLADAFRDTSAQDLDRIDKALGAKDALSIEHAAHRLAGGAGFISADSVRLLAAAIERQGSEQQLEGLETMARRLRQEVGEALLGLEQLLGSEPGSDSETPVSGKETIQ